MLEWRAYLERVAKALEEGEPIGPLPEEEPKGPARFYYLLLRALASDEEALRQALNLAEQGSRVKRYLALAVAHRVDPERHPPPPEELRRAWLSFRDGDRLMNVFLRALEETPKHQLLAELLPPAASLPLAAGEETFAVPFYAKGWEGKARVRFADIGAHPFEILVELPEQARPWLAALKPPLKARLYYRLAHGEEGMAVTEHVERFPEENLLVLSFPEFWLTDLRGTPQDERVITAIELFRK